MRDLGCRMMRKLVFDGSRRWASLKCPVWSGLRSKRYIKENQTAEKDSGDFIIFFISKRDVSIQSISSLSISTFMGRDREIQSWVDHMSRVGKIECIELVVAIVFLFYFAERLQ